MARVKTYRNDNTVTDTDRVLGTDAADNSTKNFTVEALRLHILAQGLGGDAIPDGQVPVSTGDGLESSLIRTTSTPTSDVAIPADFTFNLSRDGEGFILSVTGFATPTVFPYDPLSFVGSTWESTEYPTRANQTITALLSPPFTQTGGVLVWRFRTSITTPLSIDATAGGVGRAMTNVVLSSADRIGIIFDGDFTSSVDALRVTNGDAVDNQYISGATTTGNSVTFTRADLTSARLGTKILRNDDATVRLEAFNLIPSDTMGLTAPLPSDPVPGDYAIISNLSGITGNIIARNGNLIQGEDTDLVLDDHTASFQITFFNQTVGWIITGQN